MLLRKTELNFQGEAPSFRISEKKSAVSEIETHTQQNHLQAYWTCDMKTVKIVVAVFTLEARQYLTTKELDID